MSWRCPNRKEGREGENEEKGKVKKKRKEECLYFRVSNLAIGIKSSGARLDHCKRFL